MIRKSLPGRAASIAALFMSLAVSTAAKANTPDCARQLSREVPARKAGAATGTSVMQRVLNLSGSARDTVVEQEVLSGNVPAFLRDLTPVTLKGRAGGEDVQVTICVTPEYLSVGSDADYVRVPMGLPAAARIADSLGFFLPTTRMVDAIYHQAEVRLAPSPMKPTRQMSSTDYLLRHNETVEQMRLRHSRAPGRLTAGQKKDIVLSMRLRSKPGRVAIYGWHRTNGRPIQPLSTVHGALYADYSHGVRLVSQTAFVNGEPRALAEIMADRQLAQIVSSEGPINDPELLLASLYR